MPSQVIRKFENDEQYIAAQDRESSWSHNSHWGYASEVKFVTFGRWLGDRLCHDDVVADFGGNDGYAAYQFYLQHKVKPMVVDCEPKRIDYASKVYKLPTYQSFIEAMPDLADKSVDWGFCSHTMEHTRDPIAALKEMARVVKRGCYFVFPLENFRHAHENEAHTLCYTKIGSWRNLLRRNGWRIIFSGKNHKFECQMYAEPK